MIYYNSKLKGINTFMPNDKLQKSYGELDIEFVNDKLKKNFQKGCAKSFIPKNDNSVTELVTINTAGGLTTGDNFLSCFKLKNSKLCVSTQTAEKIYSGFGNPVEIVNSIYIDNLSTLFWIPQELILFDKSKIKRKLNFELQPKSNLFICETIIFGRKSMNENLENISLSDCWDIKINGKIKHYEAINFKGMIKDFLFNNTTLSNNTAFNFIFGYGESFLKKVETIEEKFLKFKNVDMGISIWDEKFIIRSFSSDNYDLRIALKKLLPYFYNNELPKMWDY